MGMRGWGAGLYEVHIEPIELCMQGLISARVKRCRERHGAGDQAGAVCDRYCWYVAANEKTQAGHLVLTNWCTAVAHSVCQ